MQQPVDEYFVLRFMMEGVLEPESPTDDILKYTIELAPLVGPDGDVGSSVGSFSVWRFNISAFEERGDFSLVNLFDDDSEEAADLYGALFDADTDEFNRTALGGDTPHSDVLYFQMARFEQDLKRSPVLLAAAERIIQNLGGGCAFAALWLGDQPYPKHESYTPDDVLEFWRAQTEDEQFWARIGFDQLLETLFLVRNLALRSPSSIRDILDDRH